MEQTQWQRQDVTQHYLEQVRGGIPFGAEQINVILHFTPNVNKIIDLGYAQQIQVIHGDFSDSLTPFVVPKVVFGRVK